MREFLTTVSHRFPDGLTPDAPNVEDAAQVRALRGARWLTA
jgi:hypothetical protein